MSVPINKAQMRRLQTLYGQYAAHGHDGNDRASRLEWAMNYVGRTIVSFKDLTAEEARGLIDTLQAQLGVKAPPRKRLDRDAARRAGTEGRRDNTSNEVTLATAQDLARIQYALDLLGWSQEQLAVWLASSRSPLGRRSSPTIRTLKDANRVWWALKRMAIARGLWRDRKERAA